MILHHFTAASTSHLGEILKSREIKTTVGIHMDGSGPRVVWLSKHPDPRLQMWCASPAERVKLTAMIAVDVPNAVAWPEFAEAHEVDPAWYRGLHEAGGQASEDWYVVDHSIGSHAFQALTYWPGSRRRAWSNSAGATPTLRRSRAVAPSRIPRPSSERWDRSRW